MRDDYKLLTGDELAAELGVPVKTLTHWRYQGKGPKYLRIGKHVRYRVADVEKWLDGLRAEAV